MHRFLRIANSVMGQLDGIWMLQKPNPNLQLYRLCEATGLSSQQRILGMKWFDDIANKTVQTKSGLMDLHRMVADHRHSTFHLEFTLIQTGNGHFDNGSSWGKILGIKLTSFAFLQMINMVESCYKPLMFLCGSE